MDGADNDLAADISRGRFVIFAWIVIALLFGLAAAGLVWVGQQRRPPAVRRRRTLIVLLSPLMLVGWLTILLLGALGLEDLTGIKLTFDAEDTWDMPLPNRYKLKFDAVTTEATLIRPDREAVLFGVTRVAVQDQRVFGIGDLGTFVLDTSNGQLLEEIKPPPLMAVGDYQNGLARPVRSVAWTVLLVMFPWILLWRSWTRAASSS